MPITIEQARTHLRTGEWRLYASGSYSAERWQEAGPAFHLDHPPTTHEGMEQHVLTAEQFHVLLAEFGPRALRHSDP